MLRILSIGGAVLLIGAQLVVGVLLVRWWPNIWIVCLVLMVLIIGREFVPPAWKRRGEPNFHVLHHYAQMWPPPVAARCRAELEHCERMFARYRAWRRAVPVGPPEDSASVAAMQSRMKAIKDGVDALGCVMATPRRPETEVQAIDAIFDAIADLEERRRR